MRPLRLIKFSLGYAKRIGALYELKAINTHEAHSYWKLSKSLYWKNPPTLLTTNHAYSVTKTSVPQMTLWLVGLVQDDFYDATQAQYAFNILLSYLLFSYSLFFIIILKVYQSGRE